MYMISISKWAHIFFWSASQVRSELETLGEEGHEEAEAGEAENADGEAAKKEAVPVPPPKPQTPQEVEASTFHTKLARNIHRVVFKNAPPERNELFATGRMAYVMDLEDEYAESDIPHTLIRSKADVPNAQVQLNIHYTYIVHPN